VERTIIDGGQAGPVVSFAGTESETCELSGFTIRNGKATDAGGILGGAAMNRTHATIQHNVITANSADFGGGMRFCNGLIQHNLIKGNSALGGGHNRASGLASTVGGGWMNRATGDYSMVPGGTDNIAAGQYSFAAGRRAKIDQDHHGAFLFADHLDYDFNSRGSNEFAVRATGGVRFVSEVGTGGNPSAGVLLKSGDSQWQNLSDRAAKENLVPVDGKAALARLLAVPLSTWNYKSQDPSIRHMGPMAQVFHAAFGLGDDEKYIGSLDADGVALAAIQGLHMIVQEKEARISTLEQRNAELEARMAALEALVDTLSKNQPEGR